MSGSLLATLQLADSALPIGRFVHSNGLEAWLNARQDADEQHLTALVAAAVCEGLAPLDGAMLAHADRARSVARLLELDELLTARKLGPPARAASQACGRQLAALSSELSRDPVVAGLAAHVGAHQSDGNLAVVEGALARALGLPILDTVLMELRTAAAGLFSAAVRLGRLSPVRAQANVLALTPAIERAAQDAVATDLDELRSGAFELEICALVHRRADTRFFST